MTGHVDPTREQFAAFQAIGDAAGPAYREAVKHRQAAVADSRLIRLAPAAAGAWFGEG